MKMKVTVPHIMICATYLNGWTESKYAENHAVYEELTEEEKGKLSYVSGSP